MHHKRGRPKAARAGCLMCKHYKVAGTPKHKKIGGRGGFGKLRREAHARADLAAGG